MRRVVAYCCVLIAVVALPAYGQQRADIKDIGSLFQWLETRGTTPEKPEEAKVRGAVPSQPFATVPRVSPRTTSPPSLVGADGTYLGVLSNNQYDPNSVSNPYGKYGSPYSPSSVNNPYGKYGSPYSPSSINNPYSPYGSPYSPSSVTNPYAISPLAPLALPSPYSAELKP